MSNMHTGLKLLASSLIAMFIIAGCNDKSTNPTSGGGSIWIESTLQGKCTVPMTASDPWFKVQTMNTANLQFGAAGRNASSVLSIATIIFPLNAATGTYTVTKTSPGAISAMAANSVYVEMGSDDVGTSIAQSGTVSLTVTGSKYTIDYTNLPALTDGTPPATDALSAHLAN